MPSPLQLKVFLAHSHEDEETVRDVFHLLKADGFEPWLDKISLAPGQDWKLEIKHAVRTADAVAVFLSQHSVTRAGYVNQEIALALDYAQQQPEREIYIIPIRLEECEIPDRLSHLHWIELPETGFSVGQAYLRLQRSLLLRAIHGGRLKPDAVDQPWLGAFIYSKGIPDSYPASDLDGEYLVRGVNPDQTRYYGTATLAVHGGLFELTQRIGTQEVRYEGIFEAPRLVFSGKGYTVSYGANRLDGVLIGEWGTGGVEELIPAVASKPK
jgi:TIR domain-containing protein